MRSSHQHFSAGGIIAFIKDKTPLFLVVEQVLTNGEKQWITPKGHIEKGETLIQTAKREIVEEVGLSRLHLVGGIGKEVYTYDFLEGQGGQQKEVDWFLFRTETMEVQLNEEEGFINSAWLDYASAKKRLTHRSFVPFLTRAYQLLQGESSELVTVPSELPGYKTPLKVVTILMESKGKVLLLKRSPRCTQPNKWCIPGGKVDKDDPSALAAIIRETQEETGVFLQKHQLTLKGIRYGYYDGRYYYFHIFHASFEEQPNIRLNKENLESTWSTREDFLTKELVSFGEPMLSLVDCHE